MTAGDGEIPGALTILRAGTRATVQDLGRPGFRSRGVPEGGAFDLGSHELANALVGNGPEAATVELTLFGGVFRAETPLAVALAGAPMPIRIRSGDAVRRLDLPVAFGLRPGDVLELGGAPRGARTYLAVAGGWRTPIVLGSRSDEEPLRAGAVLPAEAVEGLVAVRWPDPRHVGEAVDLERPIRFVAGPDAGLLVDRDWHRGRFVVSAASDRMGLRLEGSPLEVSAPADRPSIPVVPGAVQVSGGRPIVLGVAGGTMGGYPLVAVVTSADLGRLGQARPGDALRFSPIAVDEARRIDKEDRSRRRAIGLRIGAIAMGGGARPTCGLGS